MYIESENLELKSEVTKNLNKEIIALANTKGGTIYIGYDDESNLIGVKNAKEEIDRISNMISDTIEPNLVFNIKIEIIKDNGLDVIKIEVLKGINRPYYLKSKGMTSDGVYLGLGSTNRQATRDEIKTMIKEDDEYSFEYVRSNKQGLTFETVKREFENGSIFKQLHEALDYLNLTIKVSGKIVGIERIDRPEYNIETLRECLINSIIHKNYDMNSSIMIDIYKDNIEFVNVGGLTIDDIKKW